MGQHFLQLSRTAQPYIALFVCNDGVATIVEHTVAHVVIGEMLAIVARHTPQCTHPQVPIPVLRQRLHLRLYQAIFNTQVVKGIPLCGYLQCAA